MNCEIYAVACRQSFHWKWRHVAADGSIEESTEGYALYYECVLAARSRGYEPRLRVALTG